MISTYGNPPRGYQMVTGVWGPDATWDYSTLEIGSRSLKLTSTAVATDLIETQATPVLDGDRYCLDWRVRASSNAFSYSVKMFAYDAAMSLVWSNVATQAVAVANTWERQSLTLTPGAGVRWFKLGIAKAASAFNVWFNELSLSILPHGFHANSGVAVPIPNAANTRINFNAEEFDNGGIWSTATDRCTVKRAGTYAFNLNTYMDLVAGCRGYCWLTKNGATWKHGTEHTPVPAGGLYNFRCSPIAQLNGGDYVEALIYQDSGGVVNLPGGAHYTYFGASRIGD